jgi:hypothetical protein
MSAAPADENAYCRVIRSALLNIASASEHVSQQHRLTGSSANRETASTLSSGVPRQQAQLSSVSDLLSLLLDVPAHIRSALLSSGPLLLSSARSCGFPPSDASVSDAATDNSESSMALFSGLKMELLCRLGLPTHSCARSLATTCVSGAVPSGSATG